MAGKIYPLHCGLKIIDMRKLSLWMLLPLLAVSCAKPTGFNYLGVRNFKVMKFGLKESTVGADAEFYNPNKFPVTMKSGSVDVYVNNNFFGKTTIDSSIQVPKKDTFLLPVVLKVDMSASAMQLIQTLATGSDSVKIKLDGSAKIGRSGIFINYPIRYEGMQKIKF
ncbi:Water Stress and Hypersensitive response domain-containing protein [Niastella koreensis GR20-10]|uniref:Water Stress and Hypersensitive response domain-containing protein n=2 Tax=Niastella koreensis TaxID=354356 RepID=G8TJ31_NIAKG|nr:Water Stress and Hypersensitive response domain-containing protein [Niastella koreensis GR20-10]